MKSVTAAHAAHAAHRAGFALTEALIAALVLGVGVLGLTKLNGTLLQGTGLAKIRADATQIAQQQLEQARGVVAGSACTNLSSTAATANGVNATYSVTTVYNASASSGNTEVTVTVTWDNDQNNNRVVLRSVVSCLSSRDSGVVEGNTGVGNFIKNPTGRGKVGGRIYAENIPGTTNQIRGIAAQLDDGTRTYIGNDGLVELIDAFGQVQLSFSKTSCEQSAQTDTGFSTISGRVFVEAKNGNPIVDAADLFVLSSDASYCALLPYDLTNWVLPVGATGRSVDYFYTYYQCYIGPEWWGNVGVVRTDNAPTQDRVCVGNPDSTDSLNLFSKHPQRSATRGYRGYYEVSTGVYESQGIGVDDSACGYTAQHYTNHHFVVGSNIQDDAACLVKEQTAGSTLLTENPGKYFCMSSLDGVSCPNLIGSSTAPSTTISGTVTAYDSAVLTDIVAGSACTTSSLTASGTSFDYTCQINWTGFTAASWSGIVHFSAATDNETLCPEGATATVAPSGLSIAYVINSKEAATDANSIVFTDVPQAVTAVDLDFNVKMGACQSLGQPNVQWVGTTNPKTLQWDSIAGATGYRIFTCTVTNQNDLTSCTPGLDDEITGSPVADTEYAPGDPGHKNTTCITVQATDEASNSVTSPLKCIYQKSGTFSYLVQ